MKSIIEGLWKSKHITRLIRSAANGKSTGFEEELRSVLFLQLCEVGEVELQKKQKDNKLDAYVRAIILKQSSFHKSKANATFGEYRKPEVSNYVPSLGEEKYLPDLLRDKTTGREAYDVIDIHDAMNKLNWFEQTVLILYEEFGDVAAICEKTGVDRKYATKILEEVRTKIKNHVRGN